MSDGQKHIIEKVYLEVNTNSENSANYIKNNIDSFLNDVLLSRLEEILDEYERNDTIVRFDKLQLDFFISEWKNEREIIHEFEHNLKKELGKELNVISDNARSLTKENEIPAIQNREDVFMFFLENGFLPWYGKESYISKLMEKDSWNELIQRKIFRDKLTAHFSQNENAIQRFVLQIPSARVINYLSAHQPEKKELEKKLQHLLLLFPEKTHPQVLKFVLQLAVKKENEKITENLFSIFSSFSKIEPGTDKPRLEKAFKELNELVSNYFPKKTEISATIQNILEKYNQQKLSGEEETLLESTDEKTDDESRKDEQENESFFEDETSEIFVQNAGLILLHPFLKTFFTETGILTENGKLLKEKQMLAVQALHFLATGDEIFFEANMVFEKYLSGMPLKMPIQRESFLTKEIKSEANEMLRQVIKNWPALKNTSPDGLRQNFLQRDGKLIKIERNYRLLVERKTQDILLEKLGWNISVLKLPRRKEILFVEW